MSKLSAQTRPCIDTALRHALPVTRGSNWLEIINREFEAVDHGNYRGRYCGENRRTKPYGVAGGIIGANDVISPGQRGGLARSA